MTRDQPTPAASLLRALDRRELAAHRHRTIVGRGLGVSDDELLVLLHLGEHDAATHAELAKLVGLSRSGTSALVQRLEHAGLVERHTDAADRRLRRVVLTGEARTRLAGIYTEHVARVERVLAGFSAEEHATLARFLDELAVLGAGEPAVSPGASADPIWRAWG